MKPLIYFFIFLISILTVIAAPPSSPFAASGLDQGITIEYPVLFTVQQNTGQTLHFHIFNTSNGVPLNNNSVDCYFHLYDKRGNHVYTQNNGIDFERPFDWEVELSGTNFSMLGTYAYVFQCNNSLAGLGGVIETTIESTLDGEAGTKSDTTAGISLTLFILVISLLFVWIGFVINFEGSPILTFILKRSAWVFAAASMSFNVAIISDIASYSGFSLNSELFTYLWIFLQALYVLLLYLVLGTIFEGINMAKEKKRSEKYG